MNDRRLLRSWPLLALLCACPVEGTLGAYRTDASTTAADGSTGQTTPTSGDTGGLMACGIDGDGACPECLRSSCCATLSACAEPPSCKCMFACITAGTAVQTCVDQCTPEPATREFSMCAMRNCAAICEGAAP